MEITYTNGRHTRQNINSREPMLEHTENVFCITMLKPLENKAMYLNGIKQKDV